ncbi:MAG: ATP-binding cassette domain-containing protein [Candidatus Paracaedimonas acanthamoebae]|uniref:ATP-binding cassette domain-containing protein n=1 Tax=Candidatus Paracaedimonas acanthamoebae TaxID=244581 RepID=A0A8J7PR26_9PROT|nr:ATP-binding cassette domain-containing protein [Candidatus Paracaedimonas acanthamoebae]
MTKHKLPRIILKNVHKSFGSKKVLQGLDLEILPGESLVIIGGSGTGKSVMLKCILGLIQADKGSIQIDQKEIINASRSDLDKIRHKISMLFQGSALFDSLPVWENISFSLLQEKKMHRIQARSYAIEKLASVGLPEEVADLYPAELSGGMQRRVALARAIAPKPEILFFDEPTTGLDPIMGGIINDLIRASVDDLGATAITITHDMASAKKIADRIAMIYEGKIVWQGDVTSIEKTDNPYVQQFIHGRTQGPIKVDVK